MKIIIYVDYASSEFKKDFDYANLLLSQHNVLMVSNDNQLSDAKGYYDILLYGYSFVGQAKNIDIVSMNLSDFLHKNNISIYK